MRSKGMNTWLTGLLLLAVAISMAGCGLAPTKEMSLEALQQRGSVRVGVSPDYPPLIFESNGEIAGIEADFAKSLSGELGMPFEFVEKPFEELIRSLVEGEIDVIMSGMSVTRKRELVVQFVRPYMTIGQMAIIRKADRERFDPPDKALYVNGLPVGYEGGTTGMKFAVDTLLLAELRKFNSAAEGLAALQSGKIDAFIHDAPTAWRIPSDEKYKDLMVLPGPLTEEKIAWAVRKDDRVLAAVLNQTLAAWEKNGRVADVLGRWISGEKTADASE